jgi:16S rRNA processing protein RimM
MGLDPDKPEKFARQRVTSARPDRANHWLIHIRGVDDRDAAEKFREQYLMVSLADAVPLEEDEVYLFQVLGLEVRTQEGETLGKVTDIIETGANDVYVVQGGAYGEVLIPAISGVIIDISPESGLMLVNPPPGLLPDAKEQDTSPDED